MGLKGGIGLVRYRVKRDQSVSEYRELQSRLRHIKRSDERQEPASKSRSILNARHKYGGKDVVSSPCPNEDLLRH